MTPNARVVGMTHIISQLSALEAFAVQIGSPSIIKALNAAKNTTGYALGQMLKTASQQETKAGEP